MDTIQTLTTDEEFEKQFQSIRSRAFVILYKLQKLYHEELNSLVKEGLITKERLKEIEKKAIPFYELPSYLSKIEN